MGSGLANCIKVLFEGVGEIRGISRAFFEAGEGMTDGGDVAAEVLRQHGQGARLILQRKPRHQRARLRSHSCFSRGEERSFAQPVAITNIGHDFPQRRRPVGFGFGLQYAPDEVLFAHHPRIGLAAVEHFSMAFGSPRIDETGVADSRLAQPIAELPQHPVGGQPREFLQAQVGPMAAIGIGGWIADHPCPHRIEMEVARQRQAVAVLVHQICLEAPMEQMPHPLAPVIDVFGIAKGEILHPGRQRRLARLQRQVHMVGHQAEGVHPVAEAPDAFREQFIQASAVLGAEEDVLQGVAAQDDVIKTTGHMKARFASHAGNIDQRRPLCN